MSGRPPSASPLSRPIAVATSSGVRITTFATPRELANAAVLQLEGDPSSHGLLAGCYSSTSASGRDSGMLLLLTIAHAGHGVRRIRNDRELVVLFPLPE